MIIVYALGSGRYPVLFDSSGSNITNKKELWPAAHFGKVETVAIRPVKDDFSPYTKAELDEFDSFDFGLDVDYDTATLPKIRTTTGFTVEEVTEVIIEADPDSGIAGESITWAQITFIVDYGTDQAKAAIGTRDILEMKSGFNGYRPGQTRPGLIIQFPHLLLGRILEGGTGTPNPVEDGSLNAPQIYALVQEAPVREFSIDGATLWHSTQVDADRYYREQRNGGEWSAAIALAVGPQGAQGADSFSYVAYASDNTGTDFNLTPSDTLKYRAEIHSTVELTPIEGDFDGAAWVQYIGNDGEDAPVVQYLFSVDGSTDWHPLPTAGDFFQKISVDGGVSWSPAIKFIGNDGTGVVPQGTYDSGTTYALNEGVTYNGSYYRSLTADNIGNQPDTSPASWELMVSIGDTGDTGPEVKHIIKDSATVTNGTVVLDAYKDIYNAPVSVDTTFTFDVSGLGNLINKVVTFELHIDMSTVSVLTFPASVSWIDTPVFSNTGKYVLVFRSTDGGTNWLGNLAYEV